MIDFGDTGTIVQHTINEEMCVQFLPSQGNDVRGMLEILDRGLEVKGMERTILIQSASSKKRGYPIPCVFLLNTNMP